MLETVSRRPEKPSRKQYVSGIAIYSRVVHDCLTAILAANYSNKIFAVPCGCLAAARRKDVCRYIQHPSEDWTMLTYVIALSVNMPPGEE